MDGPIKDTIFIIDDDTAARESVATLLSCLGYATEVYCDGVDFLRSCDGSSFGCVLLDYRLPRMDGLEVLRQLRSRSAMPVILITADVTADLHEEAMSVGASALLSKPIHFLDLRAAVESALAQARDNAMSEDSTSCRSTGS